MFIGILSALVAESCQGDNASGRGGVTRVSVKKEVTSNGSAFCISLSILMLPCGHLACKPPPHTCDLNPDELAQATVRRYITHHTKTVYKPSTAILWQQVPPQCCFLSFRLYYAMSQNM